ncbi:MAG TPA: phenylalanine--tRNA ligase subunit beta, partial [Bryobacteraceae bacterium]
MKFSYRWLTEMVPGLSAEPASLERLITMKTAECEGIEHWQPSFPAGGEPPPQDDWVIEIDNKSLTHRPDLWGHYGMAREVAAITNNRLIDPVHMDLLPQGQPEAVSVEIEDYTLCPRYSALVFDNVTVAPSPLWLQARLLAAGLNPINNVVDVTNLILAELPQPMHAFDADKLAGHSIFVRRSRNSENIDALNGESYKLTPEDLVIADSNGAVAIAGVIGGAASAISNETKRIVLESANFQAAGVRLTSQRHKLRTDASIRFEKSLDPVNTLRGLARAVQLLQQVSPGIKLVGGLADRHAPLPVAPVIKLPVALVSRRLGKTLSAAEVRGILEALGFTVQPAGDDVFHVTVPSWRATKDISSKADLVEEVGRIIGYGEITPTAPLLAAVVPPASPARLYRRKVRAQLSAQGFTEVYSYSFVNESQWKRFGLEEADHLRVANPIASELTHMRRSLLPGAFEVILKNARHFGDFRFFEIGREIHPKKDSLPEEVHHLVAVLYGAQADDRDFFELKRVAECVFPGIQLAAASAFDWEHPFRTAQMEWRESVIGRLFELHPALLEAEKVEGRAFLFDVNLDLAETLAAVPLTYQPPRRYPTSAFDLSVIAPLREPVATLQSRLTELGGESTVSVEFVRQYAGPPLETGQKSVSYRIEVGALDRTLTSDEVNEVRSRMI